MLLHIFYFILCSFYINVFSLCQIPDYHNSVIVARNPGSAKKATSYAERLRLGIAVIHGEQREAESDMNDGRYSPPALALAARTMEVGVGVPLHPAKEKPPISVVGDVGGRIAIMVVSDENDILHSYTLYDHGL